MAEYRIYLVTEDDRIATAPIRITCESDAAAIQQSQKLRASRDIQVERASGGRATEIGKVATSVSDT
jgi:hypothetical protein